jgi:hypothetical protein
MIPPRPLTAAEPWKCKECRTIFRAGSPVVVVGNWFGCPTCALLTSCGQPAILKEIPCPSLPESPET